MNRLTLLAAGIVGVGVLALWHSKQPATVLQPNTPTTNQSTEQPLGQTQQATSTSDKAKKQLPEDISFDLENHPKVLAYLQKEQDKKRIQEYFANPTGHDPQAIYALIEKIESQGRVVAFEALSMKLAWLEKNTTESEFKQKREALVADYRKKAETAHSNYKPENTPGFTEYKQAEASIIKQVANMQSFPDGMSKQEYLRKRLLDARIAAYDQNKQ